jgi:hypothetical protein
MSTSFLSRCSGSRRGGSALAALAVAGTALLGAPAAVAAPGDNGDVKVHDSNTPVDDPRNDPKVCHFYLDGFNFDSNQLVTWSIANQPPVAGPAVLSGSLQLPASGHGRTGELVLPDGQYKLTWNFAGENGAGKQKVFKVDCPPATPTPTPTPTRPPERRTPGRWRGSRPPPGLLTRRRCGGRGPRGGRGSRVLPTAPPPPWRGVDAPAGPGTGRAPIA